MTMDPLMSSEVHLYCVESLASNLPLITKFPELVNCPLGILGVQVYSPVVVAGATDSFSVVTSIVLKLILPGTRKEPDF